MDGDQRFRRCHLHPIDKPSSGRDRAVGNPTQFRKSYSPREPSPRRARSRKGPRPPALPPRRSRDCWSLISSLVIVISRVLVRSPAFRRELVFRLNMSYELPPEGRTTNIFSLRFWLPSCRSPDNNGPRDQLLRTQRACSPAQQSNQPSRRDDSCRYNNWDISPLLCLSCSPPFLDADVF